MMASVPPIELPTIANRVPQKSFPVRGHTHRSGVAHHRFHEIPAAPPDSVRKFRGKIRSCHCESLGAKSIADRALARQKTREALRAREAGVKILSTDPLNVEASLENLSDSITPESQFFVRSHFARPDLARGKHTLQISGAVERSLTLRIEDLEAMDTRTLPVTLECAGNGRAGLRPLPAGEAWGLGAVGTVRWTGVPLRAVLE